MARPTLVTKRFGVSWRDLAWVSVASLSLYAYVTWISYSGQNPRLHSDLGASLRSALPFGLILPAVLLLGSSSIVRVHGGLVEHLLFGVIRVSAHPLSEFVEWRCAGAVSPHRLRFSGGTIHLGFMPAWHTRALRRFLEVEALEANRSAA